MDVQPGLCRTWSETSKTGFCCDEANIYLDCFLYSMGGARIVCSIEVCEE